MARVLIAFVGILFLPLISQAYDITKVTEDLCNNVRYYQGTGYTADCLAIVSKYTYFDENVKNNCKAVIEKGNWNDVKACFATGANAEFDSSAAKVCSYVRYHQGTTYTGFCQEIVRGLDYTGTNISVCLNVAEKGSWKDTKNCLNVLTPKPFKSTKASKQIDLRPSFLNASQDLYNLMWALKTKVAEFKNNSLRKSDSRQLRRLEMAIDSSLMNFKAKENVVTVPPTQIQIIESTRLTLAFLTVIDQFREEYDHLPAAAASFQAFSEFGNQLRYILGCDQLYVCPGSKGISHLANIIDTEAREIAAKYAALHLMVGENSNSPFAPGNFVKSINSVVMSATRLRAAVDARNGGDAAVDNELREFILAWNNQQWQNTLMSIENFGKDLSSDIQPRFRVLMTAAYSLKDYLGNRSTNLEMPDESVVEKVYGLK